MRFVKAILPFSVFFIPFAVCVTPEDIEACGIQLFGRVACTSLNYFYRECIVPGATMVYLIKLGVNLTDQGVCRFQETFGFRGNSVWVTNGCSGEFYVCYDGVIVPTTKYPVIPGQPTTGNIEVAIGSNAAPVADNLIIYIVVAIVVVILVGIGLLLGCIVKRRQQRDKSRHLAEKRQIRINKREQKEHIEEKEIDSLPLATRSLSIESLRFPDMSYNSVYEREGSVCSSRSSNNSVITSVSGITSISHKTTGHIGRSRQVSSAPDGRMRKGVSTPDIRTIARMSYEPTSLSRQSRYRSMTSSQTSLESIREVCDRYRVFNTPLEQKLQEQDQPYRRPIKYNTVGFRGNCLDRAIKSGAATLPINRTVTRAVVHNVHIRTPSEDGRRSSILDQSDGRRRSVRDQSDGRRRSVRAQSDGRRRSVRDQSDGRRSSVHDASYFRRSGVQAPSDRRRSSERDPSDNRRSSVRDPSDSIRSSVRSPSEYSIPSSGIVGNDVIPSISHYHVADAMLHKPTLGLGQPMGSAFRPITPESRNASPDNMYAKINKQRRFQSKQNPAIYATVNKSCVRTTPSPDSIIGGVVNVSFSLDDEDNGQVKNVGDRHYTHLESFKPAQSSMDTSENMHVLADSKSTNC